MEEYCPMLAESTNIKLFTTIISLQYRSVHYILPCNASSIFML